jgi:hypothetical protein
MIYKEAYQYNTGEIVFTYNGLDWFIQDHNDNTKTLKAVDHSKVAFKLK